MEFSNNKKYTLVLISCFILCKELASNSFYNNMTFPIPTGQQWDSQPAMGLFYDWQLQWVFSFFF